MALTITPITSFAIGDRKQTINDIALDSSYPTGGYSLTPAQLGHVQGVVDFVHPAQGSGGLLFQYDHTNLKLKAFLPTGGAGTGTFGAPTASGTNAVVPAGATGVTSSGAQPTLTITQPTLNPGVAAEVPNTTDLHTVTVRVSSIGQGVLN